MRKLLLSLAFLLIIPCISAYSATPEVKYAGFAFTGNYKDIPVNFKYASLLFNSTKDADGRSIFDKEILRFFKENKPPKFDLLIGAEGDTKISVAVALNRENISVVNIDDVYKIVVNICCNVTFLDFNDLKVVASYPLYLEYVDARKEKPKDEDILKLLKNLYFSEDFSILKILKERLGNIALKNTAHLSLKIINIEVEDSAKENLGVYKNNLDAFKGIMAQKFSFVQILNYN